MNRTWKSMWMVAALILGLAGAGAHAESSEAKAGREILKKNSPAVVTVTAVVKLKMSAGGQEQEMEMPSNTQATMLDSSGLAVTACSSLNLNNQKFTTPRGVPGKVESELIDLKLRLPDGTEVPAKLVMQDEVQDIAFIRPDNASEAGKKLAGKYPCVKMEKTAAPQPMDTIFSLKRLDASMDWQVAVQSHEVAVVVARPNTRYVAAGLPVGAPVFNAEGKALGITVAAKVSGGENGGGMRMGGGRTVILPAADVAESARQAPTKVPATSSATNPADK